MKEPSYSSIDACVEAVTMISLRLLESLWIKFAMKNGVYFNVHKVQTYDYMHALNNKLLTSV
jgi:hypothetical protein